MDMVKEAISQMDQRQIEQMEYMVQDRVLELEEEGRAREKEEGKEGMLDWLKKMAKRAKRQGTPPAWSWWRAKIREWEEGDWDTQNEMIDHRGAGLWGQAVRDEWYEFQREKGREFGLPEGDLRAIGIGQEDGEHSERKRQYRRAKRGQKAEVWELVLEDTNDFE